MAVDCGSTCPFEGGWYEYSPSLVGNAVMTAAFAFLVPITFFLGFRHRTPLFAAVLLTGVALEVVGFVARVLLHGSRGDKTFFLLTQLGTLVGPSLISTAVFIVAPHVMTIYGYHLSPIPPLVTAFTFYVFVVVTVVLQVVGAVFITAEFRNVTRQQATSVLAASLAVQIISLLWFVGLQIWLSFSMHTARPGPDSLHANVYQAPRFKRFIIALGTTAGLLFVYGIYRLLEMTSGLKGSIFQNETSFMIMNGLLPLACAILMTAFHPGHAFGESAWIATSVRQSSRDAAWRPPSISRPVRSLLVQDAHIRYDPNIRSRFAPAESDSQVLNPYDSQHQPYYSQTPHELQSRLGNPGLPSHPRALKDLAERRGSGGSSRAHTSTARGEVSPPILTGSSTQTGGEKSPREKTGRRVSDSNRQTIAPTDPRLVDSEAIW